MRAAWSRLSAQGRERAASIDDPVILELFGKRRAELEAAARKEGGALQVLEISMRYGIHEVSLQEAGSAGFAGSAGSTHVQWRPAGGLLSSTIDFAFEHAAQTFHEYTQLIYTTAHLHDKRHDRECVILDGFESNGAPWLHMGSLFFTAFLLLLQKHSAPPHRPQGPRRLIRIAWCIAKQRSEQCASVLLAHWASQCRRKIPGPQGAVAKGRLRSGLDIYIDDLLAQGWSLSVKRTFYEASEKKQVQRRRHSRG
jgi:hypothetical protein